MTAALFLIAAGTIVNFGICTKELLLNNRRLPLIPFCEGILFLSIWTLI
jgi:hypothetical protein